MSLLELQDVEKSFFGNRRHPLSPRPELKAVSGVTLSIERGSALGLVGESGCGKTTLGRISAGLLRPTRGTVRFDGTMITTIDDGTRRKLTRRYQLIYQDTATALNPRLTIGSQVREMLDIHHVGEKRERNLQAARSLDLVGLGASYGGRFPHQLSGGQRQRAVIARALVLQPEFIVCDEPVSALDVSVQAQIINLLNDLKAEFRLTYLFISHDLSIIKHISDLVAVMYLGQVVEYAPNNVLFSAAHHPYTRALIDALPEATPGRRRNRIRLSGDPPSPVNPPPGCPFHTRCPFAMELCSHVVPRVRQIGPKHLVACHLGDISTES